MGTKMKYNETSSVLVFRGDIRLSDGDKYFPSELLNLQCDPKTNEVVFEVTGGGYFSKGGGCNQTRATKYDAKLTLPDNGADITIKAGWARSYSSGVKVTPVITLYAASKANSRAADANPSHEL